MGTLNISSMDLRAVNVPARRPAAPKRKGPRFKAPAVSRSRKALMLVGAAGLLAAALLIPSANEAKAALQPSAVLATEGNAEAAPELAPVEPQRLSSAEFAKTRINLSTTPGSLNARGMEPISQALPFAPSTVGETAVALNVLARYIQNGSDEQRQDARLRVITFRREHVDEALCNLIRNQEEATLAVIVPLAAELKVPGMLDAVVERLQSTQKKPYARAELMKVLTGFAGDEKTDAVIDALLNGKDSADRSNVWHSFASPMPAKYVNLAFERVLQGKDDEAAAAEALGRNGQAFEILTRAEKEMQTPDQALRVRMVKLMSLLDINTAGPRLRMMIYDSNETVRATALGALAKSQENVEVLIQVLQTDESLAVKKICIEGLGAYPTQAAMRVVVRHLNDPALRFTAKRALVAANKGTDLGWQDFEWSHWIESMNSAAAR